MNKRENKEITINLKDLLNFLIFHPKRTKKIRKNKNKKQEELKNKRTRNKMKEHIDLETEILSIFETNKDLIKEIIREDKQREYIFTSFYISIKLLSRGKIKSSREVLFNLKYDIDKDTYKSLLEIYNEINLYYNLITVLKEISSKHYKQDNDYIKKKEFPKIENEKIKYLKNVDKIINIREIYKHDYKDKDRMDDNEGNKENKIDKNIMEILSFESKNSQDNKHYRTIESKEYPYLRLIVFNK